MPKKTPARATKRSRSTAKAAAPAAKRATAPVKKRAVPVSKGKQTGTKSSAPVAPVAKRDNGTKRDLGTKKDDGAKRNGEGTKRNGELEEYRELLLTLRARVRGDVEQMTTEALDRNGDNTESKSPTHLAELGTETYEQDFALRRVENEQDLLDEIDEALSRIEKGSYGLCVGCLEAGITGAKAMIPRARLKVIPYARNCVECERKREKWGR